MNDHPSHLGSSNPHHAAPAHGSFDRRGDGSGGLPVCLDEKSLQPWLDRLVDGELGRADYRALLTRLDEIPFGWRQCALSFLEAQAWRSELGGLPLETPAADPQEHTANSSAAPAAAASALMLSSAPAAASGLGVTRARPDLQRWRLLSALPMAACFLLAFWLGLALRGVWSGRFNEPSPTETIVTTAPQTGQTEPGSAVTGQAADVAVGGSPRWGTVRLVVDPDGNGDPEEIQLPVVEGADVEQLVNVQPPPVPEHLQTRLRQRGQEIQTHRHFIPVSLQDGRHVLVPVDRVEVRYVGGGHYQ
jgi:hypothetical protein